MPLIDFIITSKTVGFGLLVGSSVVALFLLFPGVLTLLLDFVSCGWDCSFDLLSASCRVTEFLAAQVAHVCSLLAVVFPLMQVSVGERPPGKSSDLAPAPGVAPEVLPVALLCRLHAPSGTRWWLWLSCLFGHQPSESFSEDPYMNWRCMPWSEQVARLREVKHLAWHSQAEDNALSIAASATQFRDFCGIHPPRSAEASMGVIVWGDLVCEPCRSTLMLCWSKKGKCPFQAAVVLLDCGYIVFTCLHNHCKTKSNN